MMNFQALMPSSRSRLARGVKDAEAASPQWPGLVLMSLSTVGVLLGPAWSLMLSLALGALAQALSPVWTGRWWAPMVAVAGPLASLLMGTAIPPLAYLVLLLGLLAGFGLHFIQRVPVYQSSETSLALAALLLDPMRPAKILDLGSAFGGVVLGLAGRSRLWRVTGVEIALLPWLLSWLRARLGGMGPQVRLRWGHFETAPWEEADLVYAYLSSAAIPRLLREAQRRLKPGALLLSVEFGPQDASHLWPVQLPIAWDEQGRALDFLPHYLWQQTPGGLEPLNPELHPVLLQALNTQGASHDRR